MNGKRIFLMGILSGAFLFTEEDLTAEENIFLADGAEKIIRDQQVDGLREKTIRLDAAGNSAVLFQVVASAVPMENALFSVERGVLPNGIGLDFYRADYFKCEMRDGSIRELPDRLTPGNSVQTEKGKNQAIYGVLSIRGEYPSGVLEIPLDIMLGEKRTKASVFLRVHPVSLPEKPSVKTAFLLWHADRQIKGFFGKGADGENGRNLKKRIFEFLAEHRISTSDMPCPWNTPEAEAFLKDPRITTVSLGWIPGGNEVRAKQEFLKKAGVPEKGFVYSWDEPKDSEVGKYIKYYTKNKAVAPEAKFLLTDNHNLLPLLKNHVDILCTGIATYDPVLYPKFEAEGKEIWWYPCDIPLYPYPTYHITDSGTAPLILAALQAKYGIQGLLYWSTILWTRPAGNGFEAQDFSERRIFKGPAPGDGILIYPPETIGGAIRPSLRLELIRQGYQDLELFKMLEKKCGREELIRLIDLIAPMRVTWTRNAEEYRQMRKQLFDMLESDTPIIPNRKRGFAARESGFQLFPAENGDFPDGTTFSAVKAERNSEGKMLLTFHAGDWPLISIPVGEKGSGEFAWIGITISNPMETTVTAGIGIYPVQGKNPVNSGTMTLLPGEERFFVFPFRLSNQPEAKYMCFFMRPIPSDKQLVLKNIQLYRDMPESNNL